MKHIWCIGLCLYSVLAMGQGRLPEKRWSDCFFPQGKAIGQPFSSKQKHIRMIRVDSFQEAYRFFLQVCISPDLVKKYRHAKYSFYLYTLPQGKGYFLFTDKVSPGRHEVAILQVKVPYLMEQGIRELHFVETIKINKNK